MSHPWTLLLQSDKKRKPPTPPANSHAHTSENALSIPTLALPAAHPNTPIPRNAQSLSSLLNKADDLNGVKWGGRAGVRGGHGKTFLQAGAASSILDWLSSEAPPEQYGELDLGLEGAAGGAAGPGEDAREEEDDDDDEEEFHVGRGRRWRTVGSSGGRYG